MNEKSWWDKIEKLLSLIAIIISVLSVFFTYNQNQISQENNRLSYIHSRIEKNKLIEDTLIEISNIFDDNYKALIDIYSILNTSINFIDNNDGNYKTEELVRITGVLDIRDSYAKLKFNSLNLRLKILNNNPDYNSCFKDQFFVLTMYLEQTSDLARALTISILDSHNDVRKITSLKEKNKHLYNNILNLSKLYEKFIQKNLECIKLPQMQIRREEKQ